MAFASFTISQPFLGAPLQFYPALGSKELEHLIDNFVTGSISKKDKLSEVTLDFFNTATVDISTGALVRTYNVALSSPWPSFEQSPISQSSSFSPPIFTPSPASSATFGDSGYGSISTPVHQRARVPKKPKKDTKKAAEIRLPGFSIMTKDGVDVTSSAGRGTKTKEQREHAHLMRIMKACDDCKRKKVRCDPSHRRAHTDMSRSSTSTTKTSSSRTNPSPTASVSSLSAYESLPSFGNAVDDFVLFPEDNASWNPADMSLPGFDSQGGFDFDMNDLDFNLMSADQSFDFSSFEPQPSPSFQQPYTPLTTDQFGLDQWVGAWGDQSTSQSTSHTRPHHPAPTQDSGQLDSSWYSGIDSGFQPDDSPISPRTNVPISLTQSPLPTSSVLSTIPGTSLEWSIHDSSSFANISPHANQDLSAPMGANRTLSTYSDSPSEGFGQTLTPSSTASSSSLPLSGLERTYADAAESLQSFQSSPTRDQTLSGELLRLRDTIDNVNASHSIPLGVTAATESILDDLNAQLKAISANVIQQRYDQLDPESRQIYVRQCQISARKLVRSLCATISSLQAQNSSPPTTTTTALTSSRNTQLLVSPSVRHSRDNQSPSSSKDEQMQGSSGSGYEKSYSQSSTHSSGSRYGMNLRENVGASLGIQEDICEYSSNEESPGFGHAAISTVRKSPRYSLLGKENVFDLRRQSDIESRLSDTPTMPVSGNALSTRSDFAQKNSHAAQTAPLTVANIAPSQQQQRQRNDQSFSRISENLEYLSSSSLHVMLARADGSLRSTALPNGNESASRGAIPRSVLEQHGSVVVDTRTPELPAGGFDMKYSMLVAAALSASLVVLNVIQATQWFLPLALLVVVGGQTLPRQLSPSAAIMITFTGLLALPSMPSIQVLRECCTQWSEDSPFSATMKLLLCCTIVAQAPALLKKMNGLRSLVLPVAMGSLLHFSPEVMSSSHQNLSKGIKRTDLASLLGILSTPVLV